MQASSKEQRFYNQRKDCSNYIVISSIDWSEIWQMPQQLANSLVESGHKVLFIENTGVRAPRLSDASRIFARVKNWLKTTHGFLVAKENITIFSPLFIPLPYSKIALAINQFLLSRNIHKWMNISNFHNPVVITFLPTPLAQLIIKDVNPSLVIYYCANDMSSGSSEAKPLKLYENSFFSNVDAVFCNSTALINSANLYAKKTFLIPAGVDYEKFEIARKKDHVPADLNAISGTKVGYIGAVSAVFDQKLMAYVARNLPNVNFIIVGPIYVDVSELEAISNIIFFGKRAHSEIPSYIKGFDVALIPYVKNAFTDAVYPCKLNEYLAMGVKVVATNLREIQIFVDLHGDVLKIAVDHKDFLTKLCEEIEEQDNLNKDKRIDVARANSWENRFEKIQEVISDLLNEKRLIVNDWRSKLRDHYIRSRIKLFKLIFVALATYCVIFYSPIIGILGNQLVVRSTPKMADAIVIFSGDGESGYINQSYQRRTQDAINYYKSGYAPYIILSSGRDSTFSEVEIIRSLLVNRGVPIEAIEIIQKYPNSTFENVNLVNKILINRQINSILLITAPHHSRRALWVWSKVAPGVVASAPPVIDTPNSKPAWSANFNQISVILYEYAAIAYYWLRGWL